MSRKAPLLFLILTMVLALSGLGIYALANPPGEVTAMPDIALITATDLHYIAPELTDHGAYFEDMIRNADGKVTDYCEELTDAFIAQVIDQAPAALILSGDLTLNGARESHAALAQKLRAVSDAGIPVLVMPGNHDLDNRSAARFHGDGFTRIDSVSAAEFAEIWADFGFSGALSRDGASLSYICELDPTLRVLMLDVNTADAPQTVKDETLTWVRGQLADAAAAGARVIAVSHQNVYKHNPVIYESYLIKNADELLALYERYDVLVNLSGHLHCQHIVTGDTGFTEIATGALSVSPNQYGVLTLSAHALSYETEPTDVAAWAAARGRTDPNLLDFAAYSYDFFIGSGRTQTPDRTDAEKAFFGRLNAAYFAGRMDTIDPDDPGFDQWMGGGFFGVYIDSIRADVGKDSTQIVIKY